MVKSSQKELSWLIATTLFAVLVFCLMYGFSNLSSDAVSLILFSKDYELSPSLFILLLTVATYILLLLLRKMSGR